MSPPPGSRSGWTPAEAWLRLAGPEPQLLDRLTKLDRTTWHDLHIWREWPAEEAIAMGQPFALREVAPVLLDLARVYLDTVWPGRGRAATGT